MQRDLFVLLVLLGVGILLQVSALKNFWGARRKRASLLVWLIGLFVEPQTAERIGRTLSRVLVFVIGCGLVGLASLGFYRQLTAETPAQTSPLQPR